MRDRLTRGLVTGCGKLVAYRRKRLLPAQDQEEKMRVALVRRGDHL